MYTVRAVETQEELRACFHLRYQVYCLKKGWLAEGLYPNEEESDEYDSGSEHYVALDADGRVVGTVRLILTELTSRPLPITHYPGLNSGALEVANSGEISRLCVGVEARNFNVELGLYRFIYSVTKARALAHCYIVVDAPFLDILNRLGFGFVPLSPPTLYFGGYTVAARCDPLEIDAHMRHANAGLFDWLQEPPGALEGTRLLNRFLRGLRRSLAERSPRPSPGGEIQCGAMTSSSCAIPATLLPPSSSNFEPHESSLPDVA